jgi:alginate O-acetyltransferase complex protein AlgJ
VRVPRLPPASRGSRVIVAAALVFLFAPAMAVIVGGRATAFENRRLAALPAVADGWGALTRLPGWLNDHLPLRQQAVQANNGIDRHVFGEAPGGTGGGSDALPGGGVVGPPTPATRGWPGAPYPEVLVGRHGYLYYGGDVATKCQATISPAAVVDRLRRLAAAVSSSGRRFVLVVPPDKSTMVPENLPAHYDGASCARTRSNAVFRGLSNQSFFLDLRPSLHRLAAAPLPGPLYLPADTHWDGPAAALMVQQLVARIDPDVAETLEPRQLPDERHVADLSVLLGQSDQVTVHPVALADAAVTHLYSQIYADIYTPRYYVSSGPPGTVVRAPTLVLGDSFALSAGETLPSVFSDLTVVHHEVAATDPGSVTDAMIASDVVVFEVVERDLVSGNTPVLSPQFLARTSAVLANHPWP